MGMDVYGRKPKNKTGEYFRANVWSWRPIYWLCYVATKRHEKITGYDDLIPDKTFRGMEYNGGYGLRSERKCKLLSDYLQDVVDNFFKPELIPFEEECDDGFKFGVYGDDNFYIDFGEDVVSPPEEVHKLLLEKGEVTTPNLEEISYQTNKEHIQEFIGFLRNCGGFQVW